MKKTTQVRLAMISGVILLVCGLASFSYAKGGSSGGKGGSVPVRGYTKQNGTYVGPYTRSAPGSGGAASGGSYNGNYGGGSGATPAPVTLPDDPAKRAEMFSTAEREALEYHIRKASEGAPWAQHEMGTRYLTGWGVERNETLGREWLTKAAKQGHEGAYTKLKNTDYFTTQRDEHGRIIRSSTARREFMRQTGFPNGRPGYVIDHVVPLKRGGCDCPENMQWQTIADAKAKDKWE